MKKLLLLFFLVHLSIQSALAGTIIVTNTLSNSVTLLDDRTLKPIKEIPVGYMPHEVIVSPNHQLALISNFGDLLSIIPGNSISVMDIANARILQTITLPAKSQPHGIDFINDSQALITAQGIQSLLLIDITKNKVIKTLPLPGAGAHMVKIDLEKRYAYVANSISGTVCKIDLKTFATIADVKIGKEAEGLALTPQEDLLFVTNRVDNQVAVIRTKDLSVVKYIQTDKGPIRVKIFNQGQSAVVINTLSGTAQTIDIASLSIKQTFKTASSFHLLPVPSNLFIADDQHTAFITNLFAGNIAIIDLSNGTILNTFKSGLLPDGISISSETATHHDDANSFEFSSGPIEINAPIESVWEIVKNVNDYNKLSKGAITAEIDGPIAPGKKIKLSLYKDKIVGKIIPTSSETVSLVDENRKILAWIRKLPDGHYTERYQLLEKVSDHQTRSFIVLRIPGIVGSITKTTLGQLINNAFQELNFGIKSKAEHDA